MKIFLLLLVIALAGCAPEQICEPCETCAPCQDHRVVTKICLGMQADHNICGQFDLNGDGVVGLDDVQLSMTCDN